MIIMLNLIIMFGFVYFASLGFRTFLSYRKLLTKKIRQEVKLELQEETPPPPPSWLVHKHRTIDGGRIEGTRVPKYLKKQ